MPPQLAARRWPSRNRVTPLLTSRPVANGLVIIVPRTSASIKGNLPTLIEHLLIPPSVGCVNVG